MISYKTIRRLLFALEPERAHRVAESALVALQSLPPVLTRLKKRFNVQDARLEQSFMGLRFPNPVGLAAGLDKGARIVKALGAVGFGSVEVGAVTPLPQPGNPRPSLFRYVAEESLQNMMGFNNPGVDVVKRRLAQVYPQDFPIGVNLGKNKDTPILEAIRDYVVLATELKDVSDYLVVNISSPNTPGLRDLQQTAFLTDLFQALRERISRPIFVKISPDLEARNAIELCVHACEVGAVGIIATNTTTDYTVLPGSLSVGGISGRALKQKSFKLFTDIAHELYGHTILINVGGIDSGEEAYRRILAGASLVQVYTAFIFQGPDLARRINKDLLGFLVRDGFSDISEAVGADWSGTARGRNAGE